MRKLTALAVKNAKPGRHVDGGGLYLLVKPSGSKSWVLRVQKDGRRRDFGLGSVADVTLTEARDRANDMRRGVRAGVDPVAEKRKARNTAPTFKEAALACHKEMSKSWTPGHASQWLASLEDYAFQKLGSVPVDQVDGPLIRDMLSPIWLHIPSTARRVRQRVGMVLDFAFAKGWRQAETPTRTVARALPKHTDKVRNFEALPFADVPGLMGDLRNSPETSGRLALRFLILTAARSGEVRGMRWSEVDLDAALWTVPAERMKSRVQHVVPLSPAAVAILKGLAGLIEPRPDEPVFTDRGKKPLADMTLLRVLRSAGVPVTVHGFRSSFRDWASEETNFPSEVVEKALAHVVANATERAYRRTDFMEKRRKLMDAWADYLTGQNNVVRLAAS